MAMLFAMAVGSAASGGYSAFTQQNDIKKQVCDTAKQTQEYAQTMASSISAIKQADYDVNKKIQSTTTNIQQAQKTIRTKQQSFKQLYNIFLIGGLVVILIVIFLLATKKFILMKVKMKNK